MAQKAPLSRFRQRKLQVLTGFNRFAIVLLTLADVDLLARLLEAVSQIRLHCNPDLSVFRVEFLFPHYRPAGCRIE